MTIQSITSRIRYFPLSEVYLSRLNVRKGEEDEGIPDLAESIAAEGLLENLIGCEVVEEGAEHTRKETIAGGRRWRALQLLLQQGRIPPDFPVPFLIAPEAAAVFISLAENVRRRDLNPADEFEAAQAMLKDGWSIEEIAERLRLEPIRVKRRLKLANVAPEFISAYRKDEIKLDHLMALASTDDHERQREVWKRLPASNRTPYNIKKLLVETEVLATSAVARFVTLKAYKQAGGDVRDDLFAQENETYLLNLPLLHELAERKLAKKAAQLRKEKHAWVDVHVGELSYSMLAEYGRVGYVERAMTEEEDTRLLEYNQELARLANEEDESAEEDSENESDEEDTEDEGKFGSTGSRMDLIEEQRATLLASLRVPDPEQVERSGALVGLDEDGKVRIERGLLRPADAKLFAEQARRRNKSQPSQAKCHSTALLHRLSAQRTMALRAEFIQHPEVALASIVHRFVLNAIPGSKEESGCGNSLEIASPARRLDAFDATVSESRACSFLNEQGQRWHAAMKAREGTCFEWILRMPTEEKVRLLAFCAAQTLDAIQHSEGGPVADDLAAAMDFDLARWWTATSKTYFASVSKATTLAAVREAISPEAAAKVERLKRKDLASEAEKLLEGRNWLPEFLRSGTPEVVTEGDSVE